MTNNWFIQFIRNKITLNIMLILVLLAVLFIAIWTRAFIGSMKDCAQGEAFFSDKQYAKAITFFDRSMHWYTPFNPYIERSAEYLWEISNRAEEINDDQLSIIALETIRNSFYGTRSFYSPGTIWIKRCEDSLTYIVRKQYEEKFKIGDVGSKGNDNYESNMRYNDPVIFWTLILEIGLLGWIGAIIGFIYFCLGEHNKPDNYIRTRWFWISLIVINYGLWIFGMIKA